MAYTIELTNNSILTVVEDGTIDNTTDIKLVGKNYSGYGEIQNENFVKLLENFASEQQPARPIPGQLWFDQDATSLRLKLFDGNDNKIFTSLANIHQGELPTGTDLSAQNVKDGDLWWDDVTSQLYVYNGTDFMLVGPKVTTNRQTEVIEALVYDDQLPDPVDPSQIANYQHLILKGIVDGKTIFISSNDDFTLDSSNSILGFDRLRKGINLVDTQEAEGGVTSSEYIINGSVTNSQKLGGVLAEEYIQRVGAEFLGQVDIKVNDGLAIGATGQLVLEYVGGKPVIKASQNDERLSFVVNDSNGVNKVPMEMDKQGPVPGAHLTYNLGSLNLQWANVHAANFRGIADKADTLIDESGNYRSLDKVENANTVVRRDNAGDIYARELVADALRNKADVNAAITAKVTQAENLLVNGTDFRTGSTAADNNTVAVRDGSGNITANVFNGVATRSSTIAVGTEYRGANVNSSANTVMVRNGDQDVFARQFVGELNGNAASATKWQTPRTITFSGDVTGSGTLDGTSDLTINITNNADSIALGTDTTGNFVESIKEVTGEAYLNVFVNEVQDATPRENARVTLGISASATAQAGVLAARDGNGDLYANTFHGDFSGNIVGDVTGNLTGDVTGDVTGDLTGNVTGNLTGNAAGDHTGTFTGNVGGDIYDYIGQGATKVVDVVARTFNGTANLALESNTIKTVSTSSAGNFFITTVPTDVGSAYQESKTHPDVYVEGDSGTLHANIFDGTSATFGTINVTTLNYVGESGGIIPLSVGGLGVDASDASGKATARSNLGIDSSGEVDAKISSAVSGLNDTIGGISTSEIKNINDSNAPQKVTTSSTNITMTHNSTGHSTYDADGITLHTGNFVGVATQAYYADLAEKYSTPEELSPGTVVSISQSEEYEADTAQRGDIAIGVVSTDPAFMMNAEAEGQYIALKGRVPVRVIGPVKKGQAVYVDDNGCASTVINGGSLVGIALNSNAEEGEKLVECVLKV